MYKWSIGLALLPCFALSAAAQQRPASQQPVTQQPAAAQQTTEVQTPQPTHYIEMPPGFSMRFEAPRSFASVIPGNAAIADAIPGQTDRVLVITSKPVTGQTNFLMVDERGLEVANLLVTVAYPAPEREATKVVIHNKLQNLAGFTNYSCNPICVRVDDRLEGSDRVPPPRVLLQQPITVNTGPTNPPPETK
jgi:hypothetical protein